jgi:hypothetical protein
VICAPLVVPGVLLLHDKNIMCSTSCTRCVTVTRPHLVQLVEHISHNVLVVYQ